MAKSFVKTESERKQTNKQTHGDLSSPWSAHSMHDAPARALVQNSLSLSLSLSSFTNTLISVETIKDIYMFSKLYTKTLVSLSYQ